MVAPCLCHADKFLEQLNSLWRQRFNKQKKAIKKKHSDVIKELKRQVAACTCVPALAWCSLGLTRVCDCVCSCNKRLVIAR